MTIQNPMFPADPPACPIAPVGTPPRGGTDLGRRRFFSRALAVPAALALPTVAIAATEAPADSVSPRFRELQPALERAQQGFLAAVERKKDALAAYRNIGPPVPSEMIFKVGDPAKLRDACDYKPGLTGELFDRVIWIMTAERLRYFSEKWSRGRARREARRRLPIAEQYEAAQAAALELSGFGVAVEAQSDAEKTAVKIVSAVGNLRPVTMLDLMIKAQAAVLFTEIRKNAVGLLYGEHQALCVADGLAIDVIRAVAISRGMAVA